MCGQSGSGKTYSLGVLLEQVLAETRLRVVVLDPNSDYVGLGDLRPGADPAAAERYAGVPAEVEVWRDAAADAERRERGAPAAAAVQRPAPGGAGGGAGARPGARPRRVRRAGGAAAPTTRRRAPPGERGRAAHRRPTRAPASSGSAPRTSGSPTGACGAAAPVAPWSRRWRRPTQRCTIVDTGSLGSLQEQRLVSQAVLAALWRARAAHTPTLVVVDEAHNVCPAAAEDPLTRLTAETADPDRRRGAEVRPLPAALDPAAAQGPSRRRGAVRQPAADAHELAGRPGRPGELLLVRAPGTDRGRPRVPPGPGPGRRASWSRTRRTSRWGTVSRREGGADLPRTWAEPRPRAAR